MNNSLKPKSSNKYRFDVKRPTTLYGLPSVVKFCKNVRIVKTCSENLSIKWLLKKPF